MTKQTNTKKKQTATTAILSAMATDADASRAAERAAMKASYAAAEKALKAEITEGREKNGVVKDDVVQKAVGTKGPKAPKAKKADLRTTRHATQKAALAKKAAKPAKKEAAPKELKLRLYAQGEFFFPKLAAEKLNGAPYVKFEAKGKTITLTPTKSSKDAQEVKFCHASPVLRVGKLLAETGWSKTTQDLPAKMVGDGLRVEIR